MSAQRPVVLEISWTERGQPRTETYGPWDVTDEEVHLAALRQFMTDWRRLKGTGPERAVLSVVMDPASWVREQEESAPA